MFQKFDEESKKVLLCAKVEMKELKHEYVGTEHVLLSMLKNSNEIRKLLNISYDKFKNSLIDVVGIGKFSNDLFLYTPLLKRVLENTIVNVRERSDEIHLTDILYSMLDEGEGIGIRILMSLDIDIEKIYFSLCKGIKRSKKKSVLDELGVDLNEKAKNNELDPVIGRDKEINRVIEILCRRTKNNPILLGDAGVGKTAIVEGLAKKIVDKDVPDILLGKKIVSLDMASSVAGTKYRGEFEERMRNLLSELEEDDSIILFIDEIHTIIGAGGAEGAIDASNIFKPALARGKMRLIGATTNSEYKKFIESDNALDRRFQKVEINEPDEDTLVEILINLKGLYESHHGVIISDNIIKKIVKLSNKYLKNRKEPDKSIDILDEVCSKVSLKKTNNDLKLIKLKSELNKINDIKNKLIVSNKFNKAYEYKKKEDSINSRINVLEMKNCVKRVSEKDIIDVIKSMINIPILELNDSDIKDIKNKLNKDIIGQKEAIDSFINILKKNYYSNKCLNVLLCGKSGSGKTHMAEMVGNIICGKNVIKLNMNEFSNMDSITKIIGVLPGYVGYSKNYSILDKIKDKPNSVLILDEIEKCNGEVLKLFLDGINEGYVKNCNNEKVDFTNLYVIMTTNIELKNNSIGFSNNKIDIRNIIKNNIGNINNIVLLNELNDSDIRIILSKKIKEVSNKYNIDINISKDVIDELVRLSEYKVYGAKKISDLVKDYIESLIIDKYLDDKVVNIDEISLISSC